MLIRVDKTIKTNLISLSKESNIFENLKYGIYLGCIHLERLASPIPIKSGIGVCFKSSYLQLAYSVIIQHVSLSLSKHEVNRHKYQLHSNKKHLQFHLFQSI